jgi:uracil-DNA glycosylase
MRAALTALTDELKRLKTTGVTTVAVSAEALAALRKVVAGRAAVGAVDESVKSEPSASKEVRSVPAVPQLNEAKPAAVVNSTATNKPDLATALPLPPRVTLPSGDKATQWAWLREYVVTHPVCLANVRPGKKVVFGQGAIDAKILFVGEAPGPEEENQGEPFVGPAGQLLAKMIVAMGLNREAVYTTNIMNWRPQTDTAVGVEQVANRAPTAEEMAFCLPFLRAQIEVVNPAVIVVLGSSAAQGILGAGSFKTLLEVRGQWRNFLGKPLIVSYHPSYLLRQESMGPVAARKAKRATWEDLLKVMERAGLTVTAKQYAFFLDK